MVPLAIGLVGCDKLPFGKKVVEERQPARPAPSQAASASTVSTATSHGQKGPSDRYAMPFAWERAEDEPLAKTRRFLGELLRDNTEYMKQGPRFFQSFAKAQRPRATVLTCSDSRVQTGAWDGTPENDDFIVRNIGNQLKTSAGSVEYGVVALGTPVLLILGHTGCGAVHAAQNPKHSHGSPDVDRELAELVLPKHLLGRDTDSAWTDAVIANVNTQVAAALERFAARIHQGQLTVVGAVYDFRNDLRRGAGRVTLVNVNGNSEPKRIEAFQAAVVGPSAIPKDGDGGTGPRTPAALASSAGAEDDFATIAERLKTVPGLVPHTSPPESTSSHAR